MFRDFVTASSLSILMAPSFANATEPCLSIDQYVATRNVEVAICLKEHLETAIPINNMGEDCQSAISIALAAGSAMPYTSENSAEVYEDYFRNNAACHIS